MSHLAQDQLYAAVFDVTPLPAEATAHLAQCDACRRAHAELVALARELAVGRASAVTPAAVDRYAALYGHVQRSPVGLPALWRRVTALLAWDSRGEPALQGVRSATAATYRLLYASDEVEVELLVEGEGHLFGVQGEIVLGDGSAPEPALIQWFTPGGALQAETESGDDGQFAARGLPPGRYRLEITLATGAGIQIEELEIA